MKTKLVSLSLVLIMAVLLIGIAISPAQAQSGVQRFAQLITRTLRVENAATFQGPVDFSTATVTGLGSYFATEDDGAVIITGTLAVSDTATFTSGVTVAGATALNGGITVDTSAFSVADATGNTVISGTLTVTDAVSFNGAVTAGDDLTVTDDLTVGGDVAITGTLQYGGLYPLGYASVGQQIVCGTITFTESTVITDTGLTTVTYVLANQITTPAATGAFLTVSDPTTSTFTLSSWEADYSEGTSGVAAHYCAIGDE